MPSSRGSFRSRTESPFLMSPALAGRFFNTSATWEALSGLESRTSGLTEMPEAQAMLVLHGYRTGNQHQACCPIAVESRTGGMTLP